MTPNQIRFADEYIKCRNATRAYLAAYPNVRSAECAQAAGSALLKNKRVQEYISRQMEELHRHTIAEAAEIMEYLTKVMRGEMSEESLAPNGTVVQTEAKISDRTAAAEKLARMLGADRKTDRDRLKLEKKRLKLEQAKAGDEAEAESVEIIV